MKESFYKFTCDVCGKVTQQPASDVVDEKAAALKHSVCVIEHEDLHLDRSWHERHLCFGCTSRVVEWVKKHRPDMLK